jgi:hypothetical protein
LAFSTSFLASSAAFFASAAAFFDSLAAFFACRAAFFGSSEAFVASSAALPLFQSTSLYLLLPMRMMEFQLLVIQLLMFRLKLMPASPNHIPRNEHRASINQFLLQFQSALIPLSSLLPLHS